MTHPTSRLPRVLLLGLAISVFGLSFPIYGIPLPGIKLTIFRAGILLLIPVAFKKNTFSVFESSSGCKWLVIALVTFGLFRLISLVFISEDWQYGPSQLIWYTEGIVFIFIVLKLSYRYDEFGYVFTRYIFYIGLCSISIIAIQYILFLNGHDWTLPLSTSIYGVAEEVRVQFGYPIVSGFRIIGPFGDPNMAGSMCAFYFALFFPFAMFKDTYTKLRLPYISIALILALVAVVGTGSRQAVVAIIASVLITLFFRARAARSRGSAKWLFIGILCIIGSRVAITFFAPDLFAFNEHSRPNVFDRFEEGYYEGDITGGRSEYIIESFTYLDSEIFLTGMGEGMTLSKIFVAPHNAYVITLLEGGIIGLTLLTVISFLAVYYPLRMLRSCPRARCQLYCASLCVLTSWILFLYINWAQLNQNISYIYIPFALLVLSNRVSLQGAIAPSKTKRSSYHSV